jgi:hypothetical protein
MLLCAHAFIHGRYTKARTERCGLQKKHEGTALLTAVLLLSGLLIGVVCYWLCLQGVKQQLSHHRTLNDDEEASLGFGR